MNAEIAEAQGGNDAIDLRQLQDFFARRWKVIASVTVTVMVLALLVVLTLTPRYTATAQIFLDPQKNKPLGSEEIFSALSLETGNVDSQLDVLKSINLLRRVVQKQNLLNDPEFGNPTKTGLMSLFTDLFASGEDDPKKTPTPAANSPTDIPPKELATIRRLKNALEVQRVNRTYVLSIAVTSENADKAARLANAVSEAYVVDQLEAKFESARSASIWLADRLQILGDQVRQSEEAVVSFRREHNLINTNSESKITLSEQQLSEINAKLATARAEASEKFAKYQQANDVAAKRGNIEAVPDVVRSTVISQLRQQQAEVSRREADLSARYSDQHPLVINTRAELRDINRSITAEVARIITNLKNDYQVAKAGLDSLQASVDAASRKDGSDDGVGVRLRELERLNAANKTLYESFLSRTKITQEQSTFEAREARIISPATKPDVPSFPKKTLVESLATVVGLLLGIAGSVALDMLNAGFLTPREIEQKLDIPVFATVPLMRPAERTIDGKVLDPPLYVLERPLSRYAEAIRAVRVGVQMSDVDHPAKVVMLTSSVPQEGKSTSAIALAFSAQKSGQRVAFIDCDLRHPSSTRFFKLENRPGLVDLLTGATTVEEAFTSVNGLMVLPAGTKSQNPPDLLNSARMRTLLDTLRGAFDYVVIDTPPVGPVIDAKVLSPAVDKIIFVVRWQQTPREIVQQNIQSIMQHKKVAGVLFNLVDEAQTPRYGPYAHYSGSYYNKYYQN
ncbi:exopolysaccharide transport family protein [Rhodoblastus sphagnicola]|nr:exopolysaccharide transport family protein [Rhodoblastus sphagnicola]